MVVLQAFGIFLFAIKSNIKCLLISSQTERRDNEHFTIIRSQIYLFSGNLAGNFFQKILKPVISDKNWDLFYNKNIFSGFTIRRHIK